MGRRGLALSIVSMLVALTASPPPVPATRAPKVGMLSFGSAESVQSRQGTEAFEAGLRDRGWKPGETIAVDYRYADGDPEKLRILAAELVQARVDVIVARGAAAIRSAAQATTTIPIVMSASGADPVQLGFVSSLARPGRNVTGLSLVISELEGKRLQLLREAVPRVKSVGFLSNPATLFHDGSVKAIEAAARTLGVRVSIAHVRQAGDIEPAFSAFAKERVQGLVVQADPQVLERFQPKIIELASRARLPVIYPWLGYVEQGGLMSYSSSLNEAHYRSAGYVDRILRGARPGDLPVEQPSKFELGLNLKTARTLGLDIPPAVRLRADHVLE